jgi:hypothetical protein
LDYAASGTTVARNIHYKSVIQEGLVKEGKSAFFTMPKWASRVLMNAPVQGTLPWFYNEILPLGEGAVLSAANSVYSQMVKPSKNSGSRSSVPLTTEIGTEKMATSPIKE